MLWDSPAWDCAGTHTPDILGAKQPPPSADKLLEQTGNLQMFSPAFYPLALQPREDQLSPSAAEPQLLASITESRTSCYSPQKFPLPSTAREGEKELSAHDAAAHTASPSKT